MSDAATLEVFTRKPRPFDAETAENWFRDVADTLLNQSLLAAGNVAHRIVEVEVYYSSPDHPDPFAHCFPIQREFGRWYFHRVGQSYRGGSYKGIDLTFSDGIAYTGILIRSLETADGSIVCGPSLVVDHLLKTVDRPTIASLDHAIGARTAWDNISPLHLTTTNDRAEQVIPTTRVGLSMKRFAGHETALDYLRRRYRFLTDPLRVKKGKRQTILALHAAGESVESISSRTGCREFIVRRYVGPPYF